MASAKAPVTATDTATAHSRGQQPRAIAQNAPLQPPRHDLDNLTQRRRHGARARPAASYQPRRALSAVQSTETVLGVAARTTRGRARSRVCVRAGNEPCAAREAETPRVAREPCMPFCGLFLGTCTRASSGSVCVLCYARDAPTFFSRITILKRAGSPAFLGTFVVDSQGNRSKCESEILY